jgi:hypothetical protein
MTWKQSCCKAGVILLEDYAVLLDYLGLLYTRSQGRCSTQIKTFPIGANVEISLKGFTLGVQG